MKKTFFKLATTSLVSAAIFGFIGCSDMLSKFDSMKWATTYTVRHLFQELNRDRNDVAEGRYTEDTYEQEILTNTVPNTPSEAKAKEIPGFTAKPFDQVIVNGDGSITIDIYYDRNPVTLTFEANGGYFVNTEGNDVPTKTIKQIYGTTVSLPKPKLDSDESIKVSLYNLVPVSGSTNLNVSSDDMFIKFPVPPTSGTYRALWDFSTSVENLSKALEIMPASGGKVTLMGDADQGNFEKIGESIKALAGTQKEQIELDLRQLKIAKDAAITIQLNNDISYIDNEALTRVELPDSGIITLGENALRRCINLEYISIGKNVEIADTNPFWGCYKVEFHVAPDHPTLEASKDKKVLLREPQNGEEGYTLVSYPSAAGIVDLGKVDLGKLGCTITTIGKQALSFIPKGKTTIIIPESVKVIREGAVYQYSDKDKDNELTIIMEGSQPPELPSTTGTYPAFYSVTSIYVPDDSVEIYKNAPGWKNYADDIYPMSEYSSKH